MDGSITVAVVGLGHSGVRLFPLLHGYEHELTNGEPDPRRHRLVHVTGPGRGVGVAVDAARRAGVPVLASVNSGLGPETYRACAIVLSPGLDSDRMLRRAGVEPARIVRWEPGVVAGNLARLPRPCPVAGIGIRLGEGLGSGHGGELIREAFLLARDRQPGLRLMTEDDRATVDLLVYPDPGDPFGQPIVEAQAAGTPVLAVQSARAEELIESGRSGCLVPADVEAVAAAIRGLARRPTLRARLARGGLLASRDRPLGRSLGQLADGYSLALGGAGHRLRSRAA